MELLSGVEVEAAGGAEVAGGANLVSLGFVRSVEVSEGGGLSVRVELPAS